MKKLFIFFAVVAHFFSELFRPAADKGSTHCERSAGQPNSVKTMDPDRDAKDRKEDRHFGSGKRDVVDQASWESFPASDPPAYH